MTEEELYELAYQETSDFCMNSACIDYACYCHYKVPVLVSEVRRLMAVVQGYERRVDELLTKCQSLRVAKMRVGESAMRVE